MLVNCFSKRNRLAQTNDYINSAGVVPMTELDRNSLRFSQ